MNPIMIACMKPNGTSQVNAKCPSQHPAGKGNPTAFTVLELLVILAIIAILAAMLLPVLSRSKLNMQRVSCLNNLRQMAISRHVYTEDNQGNLILSVVGEDSIDTAVQTGDAKVMLCPSTQPPTLPLHPARRRGADGELPTPCTSARMPRQPPPMGAMPSTAGFR